MLVRGAEENGNVVGVMGTVTVVFRFTVLCCICVLRVFWGRPVILGRVFLSEARTGSEQDHEDRPEDQERGAVHVLHPRVHLCSAS